MYDSIKSQPIFQPTPNSSSLSTTSLLDNRSSVSLGPNTNSPYGTWNGGMNRSASRRSATSSSTMSGASSGIKRSSMRGFGSFLQNSSDFGTVGGRSTSPTPTSSTSFSDVSSYLLFIVLD